MPRLGPLHYGPCAVIGCGRPILSRGWCSVHYNRWRRTGNPLLRLADLPRPDRPCLACGALMVNPSPRRRYCSAACKRLWFVYKGPWPSKTVCAGCGGVIDLNERSRNGHRRRNETKLCQRCKMAKNKHGVSVNFLAKRDGLLCRICGDPVDMESRLPDPFCPSVDHIIPRARGGTNEPDNLQLAHLWCNQVKKDREGVSLV